MPLLDMTTVMGRARWVRERCGLTSSAPPHSTATIVERCFPGLMVTGADLPAGIVELVEVGASGPVLFYARSQPVGMQRVGIAHGLYHLLSDLRTVTTGRAECNTGLRLLERHGVVEQDRVELACDLFAGEVLVPFDQLDQVAPANLFPRPPVENHAFLDECDSIASRFVVPSAFIKWRLYDLMHLRRTHFFAK